jgi:hypothetical protein
MAVGHATTPFITVYKRDGDTFTKINNPDVLPTNDIYESNGISFSFNKTYLSVPTTFSSPSLNIYKTTVSEAVPESTEISKANNVIDLNADDLGYALEDGVQGETKSMMSLWRK